MTLKKLYKQSLFYPAIIFLIIAFIYSMVICLTYDDYKQGHQLYEWYERVIINMIAALLYSVFIGVLSLPVFLNKLKTVRSNTTLSALSWFFLPFSFMVLVIGKAINEFIDLGSIWEIINALIANLPFIIGFIIGFRKFRSTVHIAVD